MDRGEKGHAVEAPLGLRLLLLVALALAWTLAASPAQAASAVHLRLQGVINPVKARYVAQGLARAHALHADFVLLSINTPGGLVSSMEAITSDLTNDPVPVIGFVEPQTAEATSAGAFILLATDVAAMAPHCRVGAAHPVGDGKALEGAIDAKATNSLVALAKSLASRHHRPEPWAEGIVRESKSYTSEEAKHEGAIEFIASDVPALLDALDGFAIELPNKTVRLATKDAKLVDFPMSIADRLVDRLSDPTLASIFLTLGVLGILFELKAPGSGIAAMVGVTSLLIALIALSTLPLKLGGIALLALGIVAIAVEIKAQTHGAVAVGGLVALVLGALVLVDETGYLGGIQRTSLLIFGPVAATVAGAFISFAAIAARSMAAPARTGVESIRGMRGDVRSDFEADDGIYRGMIFVNGALWQAASSEPLARGSMIVIQEVLTHPTRLRVRRVKPGEM